MSFSTLAKDFRPKPPGSLDPDNLSRGEEKTFRTLMIVADALRNHSFGISTYHFVNDNWSKIWPWLISSCRGVLDRPPPTTVAGVEIAYKVVEIAAVFFDYPMQQPDSSDHFRALLKPLLVSTPRILALALEMWLYGITIGHPVREDLANAVGLLLEAHAQLNTLEIRLPLGEVTKAFSKVIHDTARWDIPGICIRGIIHDLSRPLIDCYTLRSHLIILSVLSRGILQGTHITKLLQKDAIRWTAIVVAKLSSSKKYWSGDEYKFDDVAISFLEAIRFLTLCLGVDVYHILTALDEGLLVSIFRAREFIIEDFRRPGLYSDASLVAHLLSLIHRINLSLIHRPILVRVVRNLKKIERLESQLGVTNPFMAECTLLHEAWLQLKAETWRRHAIKVSQETYAGQNELRICGFHQCSKVHGRTYELDLTHTYMRCSGCHVDVYCSEKCRRYAWLSARPQAKTCEARREAQQRGDAREPGNLELAEMQKQIAFDIAKHAEDIERLKDKYFLDHTAQQPEHMIVWMDYTEFPVVIEAITAEEGQKRVSAIRGMGAGSGRLAFQDYMVAAKIPWKHENRIPILMTPRHGKTPESNANNQREKSRIPVSGGSVWRGDLTELDRD